MRKRGRQRLGTAVLASAIAHGAIIGSAIFLSAKQPVEPTMRVYAVNIVSPPPQALGEFNPEPGDLEPPTVETPVETPAETPPEPAPEPEPTPPTRTPAPPAPRPAPAPARTPPRQTPAPAPPSPPSPRPSPPAPPAASRPATGGTGTRPPSTGANPDPTSAGGENINLQMRGVQCPTPDYCENIVRQVNRYLRPPAGTRGRAEIYFVINRDGSVSGIRVVSSTGGSAFRLSAMEAVEQAGRNRAFGTLPAGFQVDQLPVSLAIQPNQ